MRKKLLIFLIVTVFLGIRELTTNKAPVSNRQSISGLVLPHHELAKDLIIRAVNKIRIGQNPRFIVVFSPNHFRIQSETFTTAESSPDFPVAREVISQLKSAFPSLVIDNDLVSDEHGVKVPIKYLKPVFPGAKYVPILAAPYYTDQILRQMADTITRIMPNETLYVASVDFSHNNLPEPAEKYDSQTINTIRNFDYQNLYKYNDNYLDSPAAMATVMLIMEKLKATNIEVWENSHGAVLTGNRLLKGTSYVTGIFFIKP
jgi:AmmeMemoRadiSam system protein B